MLPLAINVILHVELKIFSLGTPSTQNLISFRRHTPSPHYMHCSVNQLQMKNKIISIPTIPCSDLKVIRIIWKWYGSTCLLFKPFRQCMVPVHGLSSMDTCSQTIGYFHMIRNNLPDIESECGSVRYTIFSFWVNLGNGGRVNMNSMVKLPF